MGQPAHNQYAPTSSTQPVPVGFCDRCSFLYPLSELVWQYIWSAQTLSNTFLRVCTRTCLDVPNEQARVIVIGPDPVPLKDPRPGFWATEEAGTSAPPSPPPYVTEDV
jgi:hypothetical protein